MLLWSTDSSSFCEFFNQQLFGHILLILNPTVNHFCLKYYVQLVLYFLLFTTLQKHVIKIVRADDCYPTSDPETQYRLLSGVKRAREKRILFPHGKQSLLKSYTMSQQDEDKDTINQPISRDNTLNENSNCDNKVFKKLVNHTTKKSNPENYSSQWELPVENLAMNNFNVISSENLKSQNNHDRMELKNSDTWNEIQQLGQDDTTELHNSYTINKNLYGSSIINHQLLSIKNHELPSDSLPDIGVNRNFEKIERSNHNNLSEFEHPFEIMNTNHIYRKKLVPQNKLVYDTSVVPIYVSTTLKLYERYINKSPYLPKDSDSKSNRYWSGNSIPENSNYTFFNKQYNSKEYKNNSYDKDMIRQQTNNNPFEESQKLNEYLNNINKTNVLNNKIDNELMLDRYNENNYPIKGKKQNLYSDKHKHGSLVEASKSGHFLSDFHQGRPYFNNLNNHNTTKNHDNNIKRKENSSNDYRIYKNSDPTQINNSDTYHPNRDADQFFINGHHSRLPSLEQANRSASWSIKHCSDQPWNKMYHNRTQMRLDQHSNNSINHGYVPNEFLSNSFETELNYNEFNSVVPYTTTDKRIYLNDFKKDEFNLHSNQTFTNIINKSINNLRNDGYKETNFYSTPDLLNDSFVKNYSNIVNLSKVIKSKPTNEQYYQIPGDLYKLEYDSTEKGNNISIYNESNDYIRPYKNRMINNYYVSYGSKNNNNYNNNNNSKNKNDKLINNTKNINKSQGVESNNSQRHLTAEIVRKFIHDYVYNFTNQTVCDKSRFACEFKNNLALVSKIMPILRAIMIISLTEKQRLELNTSSTSMKKVQITSFKPTKSQSTTISSSSSNQIMEINKKNVNKIIENIRSSSSDMNYTSIPELTLSDYTLINKIFNGSYENNVPFLNMHRNVLNNKPRNNISPKIFLPVNFESSNEDEKISPIAKLSKNSTNN